MNVSHPAQPSGPDNRPEKHLAVQHRMHYCCCDAIRGAAPDGAPWGMLYQAYQAHCDMMGPLRTLASGAVAAIGTPPAGMTSTPLRNLTAVYELIARAGLSHERPAFGVDT